MALHSVQQSDLTWERAVLREINQEWLSVLSSSSLPPPPPCPWLATPTSLHFWTSCCFTVCGILSRSVPSHPYPQVISGNAPGKNSPSPVLTPTPFRIPSESDACPRRLSNNTSHLFLWSSLYPHDGKKGREQYAQSNDWLSHMVPWLILFFKIFYV